MNRSIALLLVLGCAASSPAAPPNVSAAPAPFSYDARAPLDLAVDEPPRVLSDVTIETISFASPRGGRVPALVVRPTASGQRAPAVVLQHGLGLLDKTELLPDAVLLARAGAVALLPDGPSARPPNLVPRSYDDHAHDPELWEHTAVDLRRAVDVLVARPDVDPSRIGYVGHSLGATIGAILAHTEPRFRAFVLIAAGASLTREIRSSPRFAALRAHVPKPDLDGYLAAMEPLDAERHLALAPESVRIFFQSGELDTSVLPVERQRAVESAARASKQAKTYLTGHFIVSPAATKDRLAFLAKELGLPRAEEASN